MDFGQVQVFLKATAESTSGILKQLLQIIEDKTRDNERLVGVVLVLFGTYAYYRHKYSYWSSRGVKTPTPVPILGNFHSFFLHPRQKLEVEWPKKYGKVYGYYAGTKPYLVVADLDALKQICIKDFDKFPNHFFLEHKNQYQDHFLIMTRDDHWRGMRAIMTPTFSSGKIKQMFKKIYKSANELIEVQRKGIRSGGKRSVTIDAREACFAVSMGAALRSFYGINLDDGKSLDYEHFAQKSEEAFKFSNWRFFCSAIVPSSILRAVGFVQSSETPFKFFEEAAKSMLQGRLKSAGSYGDYLQLLLDARTDSEVQVADSDKHEQHHILAKDTRGESDSFRPSKMKLSEKEVSCQAMMLMMVATGTTGTLLANTVYLLAHHQAAQEKLHQELGKIRGSAKNGEGQQVDFDYDNVTSCEYLDCVISESLRLMEPALAMDRQAKEDYYLESHDVWIPKGTVLFLAYHAIHHDPEYWPEPDIFNPDRFNSRNKATIVPGSYCPFGIGPRACIGFRFALTEAKLVIAKLLIEFKITPSPGTKYPPDQKRPTFLLNENLGMRVDLQPRI